jgi:hypothetical protein
MKSSKHLILQRFSTLQGHADTGGLSLEEREAIVERPLARLVHTRNALPHSDDSKGPRRGANLVSDLLNQERPIAEQPARARQSASATHRRQGRAEVR